MPASNRTDHYDLNQWAGNEYPKRTDFVEDNAKIDAALYAKVDKTGEASTTTAAFTEAVTRTNIGTGETLAVLFGKIKKFFTDLKTVALTGSFNDLTDKPTIASLGGIPTSQKGAANGVAELDSGGKVPSTQLPSYVDDVLEYASQASFPGTGESGKIYVALDTNKTYRWSGSAYTEISQSIALGETSATAYRGDRGKTAYDHSQATGNLHGLTRGDISAAPAPLSGASAPTTGTVGEVGQFYLETTTPQLYQCTAASGTYTWKKVGESSLVKISSTTTASATPKIDISVGDITEYKELILFGENIVGASQNWIYVMMNDNSSSIYQSKDDTFTNSTRTYIVGIANYVVANGNSFTMRISLAADCLLMHTIANPANATQTLKTCWTQTTGITKSTLSTINIFESGLIININAGAKFTLFGVKA